MVDQEIAVPRRAIVRRKKLTPADIVRFYKDKRTKKKPFGRTLDPERFTLTNTPTGIGDSVMMTDLPRAGAIAGKRATSWLCCEAFRVMAGMNPYHLERQVPFWVSLSAMVAAFDIGPGHNLQRARRMFGLPVDPWPSGSIVAAVEKPRRMRVSLHLEAGPHSAHQKEIYHPRAREVYPENIEVVKRFIRNHPELDFIEVGGKRLGYEVPSIHGASLRESITEMAKCSIHIGIISGPYHIANALGLRTICIINFPSPWQLMLPAVKAIDVVESEWLYPQTHILHQDHDSAHWPKFSLETLEAAFNMETYPYAYKQEFLNLVSK